jgi:hypothetical protein
MGSTAAAGNGCTNCTFIGTTTTSSGAFTNSTAIGANSNITASNQVVLGNSCNTIIGLNLNVGGTITSNSTVTGVSFVATSDYRVKTNVIPLTSNYNVNKLNPVSYYNKLALKQDIGFIAHEVQEEFPELVIGEKDGESNQALNYSGLIPILVKEVKDLKQREETLKTTVESFKTKVESLTTTVETLNTTVEFLKKRLEILENK